VLNGAVVVLGYNFPVFAGFMGDKDLPQRPAFSGIISPSNNGLINLGVNLSIKNKVNVNQHYRIIPKLYPVIVHILAS